MDKIDEDIEKFFNEDNESPIQMNVFSSKFIKRCNCEMCSHYKRIGKK